MSTLASVDTSHLILIGICAVTGILIYGISVIKSVLNNVAEERTRREVAAYVAEGSISADDAARILAAGGDECEKMIADGVAWGTVNPEKAEKLIRTLRSDRAKPAEPSAAKK